MKHFLAFLATAALVAGLAAAPPALTAFAADDGVYLASTNTYYLNPDTGVTDDGGSKNAAIGEGMCRSVIYEKALVEIDGGKVYVTVRVQLVSNMGAITFTAQKKAGDPSSYASVSPRITAEDAAADTADYRFSIPSVGSYIGCSTYVTPMGRDVKFYMNLSESLTAGSDDFIVSIKPAPQTPAAQAPAAAATDPPAAAETAAAAPAGDVEQAEEAGAAPAATEAVPDESPAAGGALPGDGTIPAGSLPQDPEEAALPEAVPGESPAAAPQESAAGLSSGGGEGALSVAEGEGGPGGMQAAPVGGTGETGGSGPPALLFGVVAAIVAAAVLAFVFARRKRA
jgi:hypothetical protein